MGMETLLDHVDAAWAEALGCSVSLLAAPGPHIVTGGPGLAGYRGVYMARLGRSVLVYAPPTREVTARQVLSAAAPEDVFSADTCLKIAGPGGHVVLGPSWHGFVDVAHFQAAEGAAGERIERDDPELGQLRRACSDDDWSEAGFADPEGLVYGLLQERVMVAAGNMTDYRTMPADVGVVTHPGFRGRGWARRLVSHMTAEQLPTVGVVRYRALQTNLPSLAVASSLGFIGRGENLAIRLKMA
jgi:GNAT superfamily N-acetyltransferase